MNIIFFITLAFLFWVCFKDGVRLQKTYKNRHQNGRFKKLAKKEIAKKYTVKVVPEVRKIPVRDLNGQISYIRMIDYRKVVQYA